MRCRFVAIALAGWFSIGATVEAQAVETASMLEPEQQARDAEIAELAERVHALETPEVLASPARGALDEAKRALTRLREASVRPDAAAAERAARLVRASLALAERQLSLQRERELMRAANARREATRARAALARQALERERARAQELTSEGEAVP